MRFTSLIVFASVIISHLRFATSLFFGCSLCSYVLGYGQGLLASSYYYQHQKQGPCYSPYACGSSFYPPSSSSISSGSSGSLCAPYGCCLQSADRRGSGNSSNANLLRTKNRGRLSQIVVCSDRSCSNCDRSSTLASPRETATSRSRLRSASRRAKRRGRKKKR